MRQGFQLATQAAKSKNNAQTRQAIELFKRSFALDPNPLAECNIGIAYKTLGQLDRAHLFLGNCIARMGAARPKALAPMRKLQSGVERDLRSQGYWPLDVRTKPGGALVTADSFAKGEQFRAPRLVWLKAGEHKLTAHHDGYKRTTVPVSISATRSRFPLVIELDKAPAKVTPNKDVDPPPVKTKPIVDKPRPIEYDLKPAPRGVAPLVTLSLGIAALAGGGIMHAIAFDKREDLKPMQAGSTRDAAVSTFENQRLAAIGLYAVGAIATGIGAYLYTRKRKMLRVERTPTLTVAPLANGSVGALVLVRGQL